MKSTILVVEDELLIAFDLKEILEAEGFNVIIDIVTVAHAIEMIESEKVYRALGDAARPLSTDDLRRKFFDCFEAGQSAVDAGRLLADLQRIEKLPSCRMLFERSRAARAA